MLIEVIIIEKLISLQCHRSLMGYSGDTYTDFWRWKSLPGFNIVTL